MERKAYPSDIRDDEWGFVSPYLNLMTKEGLHGDYSLGKGFSGLCWLIQAEASWRMIPQEALP